MESVRLAIALVMLVGASLSDLRIRRVRDHYWKPFIAAAVFLAIHDGLLGTWSWTAAGIALATCAFLYGLWWLGLFGGADAKGLMVLAWLWPADIDLFAGATTPTLDALLNGALLVTALPILMFGWNLMRGHVRFPAMLLGVKMAKGKARARHVWPMERPDGSLRLMHRPGETIDWSGLPADVWITPKVPFMLPLTAGLLLASQGNIILRVMGL